MRGEFRRRACETKAREQWFTEQYELVSTVYRTKRPHDLVSESPGERYADGLFQASSDVVVEALSIP